MATQVSTKDKNELQTLHRGLHVLKFLNETGPTSLAQVARYLKTPRSNARRILQTLVSEGYLERYPETRLYALTPLVMQLSTGFNDHDLLTTVARSPLHRMAKDLVWPMALATPYGSKMLVRIATDHLSPVALARFHAGYLTPILATTTGLLFLALSDEKACADVIEVLKSTGEIKPHFASVSALQQTLKKVRKDRYIIRDQLYPEACLGVPLVSWGRVHGGFVVRYIKKAMSNERAVTELLPRMRALADEVVEAFERAMIERTRPGPNF